MTPTSVYLDTLGCRLNEAELEAWARAFHAGGCRVVADPESATLVVLNSCAVTAEAARKSRQFVRRVHRRNPSARLVVTGCYAELEPAEVADLTCADIVIGNEDKEHLVENLLRDLDIGGMPEMAMEPGGSHLFPAGRTRAFVKVQDGCRHRCTFCIVTIARGAERSRGPDEIIDEVNALAETGYQEVVLTGVHLGGYGHDLDTTLHALVSRLLSETDIPRLRLSSLEPWDIAAEFWGLWVDPRLMPHLHLPLQSGSDAVLKRMGRRGDRGSFRRLVTTARGFIPELTLTTDIIVGFPEETDAQWSETLAFVEEIGFAHVHSFAYSSRRGTAAARLPGHLPKHVKRARAAGLRTVAGESKRAHLERYVGTTRSVLWEGVAENSPDGQRLWRGLTDNYLRVETHQDPAVDLQNRIRPTRLETIHEDRFRGVPVTTITTR